MWLGIQRLVDLLIEFLIKRTAGATYQDKILNTYKNLVMLITVLAWVVIILGIAVVNAKLELREYRTNSAVVQNVLTGDDSVIGSFIETNKTLNDNLAAAREDNLVLIKDNYGLMSFNKQLLQENYDLRLQIKKSPAQ